MVNVVSVCSCATNFPVAGIAVMTVQASPRDLTISPRAAVPGLFALLPSRALSFALLRTIASP